VGCDEFWNPKTEKYDEEQELRKFSKMAFLSKIFLIPFMVREEEKDESKGQKNKNPFLKKK
jgi:hypothetical protein